MSEIHALSGAYAVDALDDDERAQFERHLAECPACRSEVDSLREAAALLAETTVTEPSPAAARPGAGRHRRSTPAAAPAGATVTALEPRRRRRVVTFLVAAAAAVAIGTGGIVWQQVNDDGPSDRRRRSSRPTTRSGSPSPSPGGATATVVRSEELNEAVVVTQDMPAAPDGHAYALWLQHDDVMVPAGIMPDGPDNEVVLSGDAASANGAGITVETAGQEPTEPSDDVVALFTFDA